VAKSISIAVAVALLLVGAAFDEATRRPKYVPPGEGEQDSDEEDKT
jgi:hypothetical protein